MGIIGSLVLTDSLLPVKTPPRDSDGSLSREPPVLGAVTRLSRLVTSDPYGSMLCRPCLGSGRPAFVEVPYPFRRLSKDDGSWDVNKTVQRVYASTRVSDLPPCRVVEPILRPYP